jgi:hypothetical protein
VGRREVVDPEADVVERGLVYFRAALWIDGLHQVDLDAGGPGADLEDVLVDVLALAAVGPDGGEAQEIPPEAPQGGLVGTADGDLLHPEDSERTFTHGPEA